MLFFRRADHAHLSVLNDFICRREKNSGCCLSAGINHPGGIDMMSRSVPETNQRQVDWQSNPKTYFLAAGFASFLLSVSLWFSGNKEMGLFVGLWVPSICSAGALILAGGRHD
jgi:hypothetical protein